LRLKLRYDCPAGQSEQNEHGVVLRFCVTKLARENSFHHFKWVIISCDDNRTFTALVDLRFVAAQVVGPEQFGEVRHTGALSTDASMSQKSRILIKATEKPGPVGRVLIPDAPGGLEEQKKGCVGRVGNGLSAIPQGAVAPPSRIQGYSAALKKALTQGTQFLHTPGSCATP
jgi:hypothetical protein